MVQSAPMKADPDWRNSLTDYKAAVAAQEDVAAASAVSTEVMDVSEAAKDLRALLASGGIRAPAAILEIGAGDGRYAAAALSQGISNRYLIVDLPPALGRLALAVRWAISNGSEIRLLSPAEIGLIPPRSVDLVVSFYALDAMDDATREVYVRQAKGALRPGGAFVTSNGLSRQQA